MVGTTSARGPSTAQARAVRAARGVRLSHGTGVPRAVTTAIVQVLEYTPAPEISLGLVSFCVPKNHAIVMLLNLLENLI